MVELPRITSRPTSRAARQARTREGASPAARGRAAPEFDLARCVVCQSRPAPGGRCRRATSSPPSAATLERHQHERQRASGGRVEAQLELGEDLDGECLVLQDLKRPVLGQEPERHEQAAAEHSGPDLAQRDPPEHPPRTQPRLREASSSPASRLPARCRQVHEWIQRQGHDHHSCQVPVERGVDRDPAEATTKSGTPSGSTSATAHSRRQRERGALHTPRRTTPSTDTGGAGDGQPQGVPQQQRRLWRNSRRWTSSSPEC